MATISGLDHECIMSLQHLSNAVCEAAGVVWDLAALMIVITPRSQRQKSPWIGKRIDEVGRSRASSKSNAEVSMKVIDMADSDMLRGSNSSTLASMRQIFGIQPVFEDFNASQGEVLRS